MAQILIVDDDAPIREALRAMLERAGHRVTEAEDGLGALQCFEKGTFDLIVSDVLMPEMNGFELLQSLRSRILDRVPFVILSSHDDRESIKAALFAGAYDYILKPFDEVRVRDVVERALALPTTRAPHVTAAAQEAPAAFTAPPLTLSSAGTRSTPDPVEVLARAARVVSVASPASRHAHGRASRGGGFLARLLPRRHP